MTEQDAYSALTAAHVFWQRINKNTIRVYMSSDGNGSHHTNLDRIKEFLERANFFEFDRDFDRICGQGFSDFKFKGGT